MKKPQLSPPARCGVGCMTGSYESGRGRAKTAIDAGPKGEGKWSPMRVMEYSMRCIADTAPLHNQPVEVVVFAVSCSPSARLLRGAGSSQNLNTHRSHESYP